MNTRLQQFLNAENISQAQLADTLEVARAGVSHILAGRNKPSYDFITSLMLRFPKLNIEWLMFGKGKMYKDLTSAPIRKESNLLFDEVELQDDEPEASAQEAVIPDVTVSEAANIVSLADIKNSAQQVQSVVKQRNVKKILILFDDGSYQEM